VKTWHGDQIEFLNGCIFDRDQIYWNDCATKFEIKMGESTNSIEFDKIKSIQLKEEGKPEALMTTFSGKTVEISFCNRIDDSFCLGGNWEKFGSAFIKMKNVASFEISKTIKQ